MVKMKLQRKEIANKYYGKHTEINTENKDNVINYLDELLNYLSYANGFEYESNPDFIFCGRKKFIYDEIIEIIGGTKFVDNPVYFVLGSLEELICDNNNVHISDSDELGMSWNELRDANDRYISTGVICLEEIQYIRRIILLIKDHLEDLIDKKHQSSSNKDLSNISKEVFNKILNLPVNKEFIIGSFLEEYNLEVKDKFEVQKEALSLCKSNNVNIKNLAPDSIGGMPWSCPYMKIESSNEQPINKGIHTLQEQPWVNYLTIDEITLERKISDDAPEEIKTKYQEYVNKKIDSAVNLLSKKIKQIDTDSGITVLELLGPQPERFNETQLTKIATIFFEKNKDLIEFVDNPNEKIGLIYNLPFKKKSMNLDRLDSNYNFYKKNENDNIW